MVNLIKLKSFEGESYIFKKIFYFIDVKIEARMKIDDQKWMNSK